MTEPSSLNPLDVQLDDFRGMVMALPPLMIMAGEMAVRAGDHLIFTPFGINVSQYSLLVAAHRCRRFSMTDLKKSLFMPRSASSVTQMVDELEKRDLVRRVPSGEDRRVNFIEITDAGQALLEKVDQRTTEVMRDMAGEFQPEELRATVEVLRRFITETARELGFEPVPAMTTPTH